ncbi:hypothetical protein HBA54_04885 [Pelagibius litoralis]|uniref:Lipoprotein n=1 Tax=Pelagibius litoralis TaxID=374515 RepID=A0A967C1S8_9PROT|nr:hypothetical protein [Pelagibius litoralis]NIA67921.1 hypothetical protein [Pelagibius litoralis]
MFRCAVVVLALAALSGCASAPGSSPPQATEVVAVPIAQAVEIGRAPVRRATRTERQTVTAFGRYGKQGRLTLETRALLDASKSGSEVSVELLFTGADTKSEGVQESAVGNIDVFRGLEGVTLLYRRDLVTGRVRQGMVKDGRAVNIGGTRVAITGRLIAQSHLGGMTLRQGQTVMEFSLSDFLSGLDPIASPTMQGTVAGRSVYQGRDVVVVTLDQSPEHRGVSYHVKGTYLIDVLTGLPVSGRVSVIGDEDGQETIRLAVDQRLVF